MMDESLDRVNFSGSASFEDRTTPRFMNASVLNRRAELAEWLLKYAFHEMRWETVKGRRGKDEQKELVDFSVSVSQMLYDQFEERGWLFRVPEDHL